MVMGEHDEPRGDWIHPRGAISRFGVVATCFISRRRSGKIKVKRINLLPGFRIVALFFIQENQEFITKEFFIRVRGSWQGKIWG
jgi:hypothetical protein